MMMVIVMSKFVGPINVGPLGLISFGIHDMIKREIKRN